MELMVFVRGELISIFMLLFFSTSSVSLSLFSFSHADPQRRCLGDTPKHIGVFSDIYLITCQINISVIDTIEYINSIFNTVRNSG